MANLLKFAQPQQYAPLQVGVAAPQNLQVGNRVIAPGPGRSGVAPPVQRGNLNSLAQGFIGGAETAAANTVRAATDLRFLTPNFVPGVSKYVDPFIHSASNALASPFQAGANAANQVAPTKLGHIGNVAGQAGIYAPQAISAARGAVQLAKQVPHAIEAGGKVIANVNDARTPLNQIGAVGKNVNEANLPPEIKPSKFVNTVKNSTEASAPVKAKVAANYRAGTNAEKVANSQALVNDNLSKATNQVNHALNQKLGTINAQDVSNTIAVAKAHDVAGNTDTATQLYNRLSRHLTASGQTVQAASLLARRSPEGLRNSAISTIEAGGKTTVTPDLKAQIQDAYTKIKGAQEGSNERAFAVQDLQKIVNNNVKHSKLDQGFMLWRTGLLTGPLTASKVAVSHTLLNTAEKVKDLPAVALDKVIAPFSGVRSTALTGRGIVKGAAEGTKAAGRLLLTGHDTPGTSAFGGTYEDLSNPRTTFGNSLPGKAANLYTQKVGQVHAGIPKAFYRSAYENDLNKQAIAAATNQGVKLGDRNAFIKNFVTNPSAEADQGAHIAAQKASFQQPSFLGKQAGAIQKVPGGRVLVPFARIASAILTDVKDYSPIGAMQSVYNAAKASKTGWTPAIQKALVEGVGRGVTGTGIVALGSELYKKGDITTGYPTTPKERALWAAEGKQENSIKVNGKWQNTAALGPFGSLLAAGALYQSSKGTNAKGQSNVTAALTGALTNISGQSYLSGLTQGASAVQNPQENLKGFVKLEAGSVVPVGVGQVAAALDKNARTASTPIQAIQSKIPGLRQNLPTALTPFGQPIKNGNPGIGGVTNPLRPTTAINEPVTNELQRLTNNLGTSPVPVPLPVTKLSGVGSNGLNKSVPLSKAQQAQFTQAAGPLIHSALANVMNSAGYNQLDDNGKAKALSTAKTNAENIVKTQFFNKLNGTNNPVNASLNSVANDSIQKAKVAADTAAFKTSGQNFLQKDSMVYQKGSDGKVSVMEQRSYDYKQAYDGLTSAKSSRDVTGYLDSGQSLLGNISWQLNHATLTQSERDSLVKTAVRVQNGLNETNAYGGFDKPKGVATYKAPEIIGAKDGYVSQIQAAGAKYGLDINALLAVAAQEGLGGGVGDNGTSFGPFQIHAGGALPPGKSQAWAESPAGIDYAVQQIAKVAGGKHGADAIQAIVTGFEKSANQPGEIQNALALYGGGKATLSPGVPGGNATYASVTGSSSSSSSAKPKVPNFKTSLSSLKAPKVGKISARGSKAPKFNTPKVASLKTSTPKVRSSRQKSVAKLPVSAIPKIPKKQLA